MVSACYNYLTERIKTAMGPDILGNELQVHTSLKELKTNINSHIAAVIARNDTLTYSGRSSPNIDTMQDDTKLYDRVVVLDIVLGEESAGKLSPIFETFAASLERGFVHEGHYIAITTPEPAEWVDKKDSILNAEIAVELPITFTGGIYRVRTFAKIEHIEMERSDNGK